MKIKKEENQTIDLIQEWKDAHGKIFKTIVNGKEYIWRRVKRKEYSTIMAYSVGETGDERLYNRQAEMTKAVVLNIPQEELENDIEELAGLAITISEEVLEKSGFSALATIEL